MSPTQRTLYALIDRIFPGDSFPSASDLRADQYVWAKLQAEQNSYGFNGGLEALDSQAQKLSECSFSELPDDDKDALLLEIETAPWFARIAELVAEGTYADPDNGGNYRAAGWTMVGYRHGLPEGPSGPPISGNARSRWLGVGETEFDVIIVGAGAGGGVAACVLAEAGKRVLLIERGLERQYGDSGHRDHLRNHRMPLYGHNTGPDLTDNPRVAVGLDGTSRVVSPIDLAYHNNASCVGSGTFVYGGMAWRFHPDDFKMASRYGVPDGSSLADWPLSYEDLAPWYERAEWEIGVAGAEDPLQHGARTRGYPMPPLPRYSSARILERGAEALGLPTFSPPLLINSVRRDGRPACIECGTCVGFPCPSDAKNGTQNTAIPRAIATGRCTLVTGAMVTRVETDDGGRVLGVRGIFPGELHQRTIRARAVVLSCGAIESARLLLNSASSAEPRGLGNAHDLVGRNLQGHIYPTVFGLFDEPIHAAKGPGVTIATTAFNHGNSGIVGGAVIADDFVMPPITFWRQALPGDLRRWGNDNKRFMRDNYSRVGQLKGPIQEIPSAHARVSINPATRDAWHVPVAELSGIVHEETMRTAEFIASKADQWLKASGATKTWRLPLIRRLSAGQHQAGTCRMGTDPTNSVTDSHGRVWGHKNLFVCDASLHPTNGGFNPVLTIMAMAFRNAEEIARSL